MSKQCHYIFGDSLAVIATSREEQNAEVAVVSRGRAARPGRKPSFANSVVSVVSEVLESMDEFENEPSEEHLEALKLRDRKIKTLQTEIEDLKIQLQETEVDQDQEDDVFVEQASAESPESKDENPSV